MTFSLVPDLIFRAFDANGMPLAGGKLYTFLAGSSTPQATWTDSTGSVQNANPVILDSTGAAHIFLGSNTYKFNLFSSLDVQQPNYPVDNISRYSTYGEFNAFTASLSSNTYASQGAGLLGYRYSSTAAARTLQARLQDRYSVVDLSVPTNGTTDATTALNAFANVGSFVEIQEGTYKISQFPAYANKTYTARGNAVLSLFNNADSALVKFKSGSNYFGFEFRSTEADLNSQRVAIDDCVNVYSELCKAYDFRNPSAQNAWGVLIQRSSNITLVSWTFGNNTQSDIAITDNCRNLTIINPVNTADGGVNFNIEPNTNNGVVGMNVIGGHYRLFQCLENDTSAYASKGIVVTGAPIDQLKYDGSGIKFVNCRIGDIVPESQLFCYAGALSIDSISLLENLIGDPYLFDVSVSDANSFWVASTTLGTSQYRVNDATFGKFLRINPGNANATALVTTRNFIACSAAEKLLIFVSNLANNVSAGTVADHLVVQWFNSGSALLSETVVYTARCNNTSSGICNDVAALIVPASCTKLKVRLTNRYSGSSISNLDVGGVGLFRYSVMDSTSGNGNMESVIQSLSMPVNQNSWYTDNVPSGSNGYAGSFVGEHIIKKIPVVGQPKGWYCTALPGVTGDPGVLVSEGNL